MELNRYHFDPTCGSGGDLIRWADEREARRAIRTETDVVCLGAPDTWTEQWTLLWLQLACLGTTMLCLEKRS